MFKVCHLFILLATFTCFHSFFHFLYCKGQVQINKYKQIFCENSIGEVFKKFNMIVMNFLCIMHNVMNIGNSQDCHMSKFLPLQPLCKIVST